MYPHSSWNDSDLGRNSWFFPGSNTPSNTSLSRPSPAAVYQAPFPHGTPSSSTPLTSSSAPTLSRSSPPGESVTSPGPPSGLCLYHLAGLYQVQDHSGRPLQCTRPSCRLDHPPSQSGVPLDRIRSALLNSNARPHVKTAVADRAGVSL